MLNYVCALHLNDLFIAYPGFVARGSQDTISQMFVEVIKRKWELTDEQRQALHKDVSDIVLHEPISPTRRSGASKPIPESVLYGNVHGTTPSPSDSPDLSSEDDELYMRDRIEQYEQASDAHTSIQELLTASPRPSMLTGYQTRSKLKPSISLEKAPSLSKRPRRRI